MSSCISDFKKAHFYLVDGNLEILCHIKRTWIPVAECFPVGWAVQRRSLRATGEVQPGWKVLLLHLRI